MHRRARVGASLTLLIVAGLIACDPDPSMDSMEGTDDGGDGSSGGVTVAGTTDTVPPPPPAFFSAEERETILSWLGPLPSAPPPDPTNAYADDAAAAALGQRLFFDPGYSESGEISCATCHDPEVGFSDARANVSEGMSFTTRSSMGLLNGAFGAASEEAVIWQFWDGRSDSQWSQALGPPENAVEMGSTRSAVALHVYDNYRADYEAVFGALPALRDEQGNAVAPATALPGTPEWDTLPAQTQDAINEVYANFGKAIAAYERKLESRDSRFDLFWNELASGASDSDVLTVDEKEGLRVFIGAGRCLGCHSGPNFTDGQFHNIAVPQTGQNIPASDEGRAAGLQELIASEFNCAGPWSDHPDKASCAVLRLDPQKAERGAFKTPSLRSVSQTAPYMHTGNFPSLESVIQHYDFGGGANGAFTGTRDELIRPLALDARQRMTLIAFLRALDGEPIDPSLTTVD